MTDYRTWQAYRQVITRELLEACPPNVLRYLINHMGERMERAARQDDLAPLGAPSAYAYDAGQDLFTRNHVALVLEREVLDLRTANPLPFFNWWPWLDRWAAHLHIQPNPTKTKDNPT